VSVLLTPTMGQIDCGLDGTLTVVHKTWTPLVAEAAENLAAASGMTLDQVLRATPASELTATSDAHRVDRSGWCDCGRYQGADVRYEVHERAGRVAHGFCCSECRKLTQVG
jgi:hypothetical protein